MYNLILNVESVFRRPEMRGWNGLVDGYPCYHRECDTMDTMIDYMETDDSTGVNNLVHSWDIVTWWAVYAFLHMDQTPVPNEL